MTNLRKTKGLSDSTYDISVTYNQSAKTYAKHVLGTENKDKLVQFRSFLKPPANVIDIGCAAGRDSRLLQGMGYKVTGVDLADKLLAIARQRNPDISFVMGDARELPFQDAIFDGVWASAVLHHTSNNAMKIVFNEWNRVLVPGGLLYVYTKAGKGILRTQEASVEHRSRTFYLLSVKELENLALDAGFKKILVEEIPSKSRNELMWLNGYFTKVR